MSSVTSSVGPKESERRQEPALCRNTPGIVPLQPAAQHYAWGDPDFIPALLGRQNRDGKPWAELWIGAHPDAPAGAMLAGKVVPLNQWIESAAEPILHPVVAERFGRQLPFLFKLLAAAAPLSLQTHPNKRKAEEGFDRENKAGLSPSAPERNYRDANHKPELIVALTDFYGLRGFRRISEIAGQIERVPELRAAAPGFQPNVESLQALYATLMNLPPDRTEALLTPLVERLVAENRRNPFSKADPEFWLLRADQAYSRPGCRDRGLFSFYLLNLVHLRPGDGMYLPAGILHAYLEGAGVELMANSNNVIRGGLTAKHIDVPELLRNVSFECAGAEILRGCRLGDTPEWIYPTPAAEFELSRIELDEHCSYVSPREHSVEIFIPVSAQADTPLVARAGEATQTFRRGQAFLVTHGTAYELTAGGPMTLFKAAVPLAARAGWDLSAGHDPLLFRGRTPAALAFGTSGLRGLVSDITDLEAYINTRGFLEFLRQTGDAAPGQPISIAGDLRPSSDSPERSIMRAVTRAIVDAEFTVDHLGQLPTPALTYYAMKQRRPSIMVTGSHIPFDRNGIKFNKSDGEVLKSDEPAILQAISRVRAAQYALSREESLFADDGMFKEHERHPLPQVNPHVRREYLRRYLDFFPENALAGRRIVFYQHSAVARDLLVELLTTLGAQTIPRGRSETFVPVDTEAISPQQLEALQDLAGQAAQRHGPIDAIVSTDGDSDRPLIAGVDPTGQVRFFGGDLLGIVVADFLRADAVAVPISANDAVDQWAAARRVAIQKTRIGSPFVIEAMKQAAARGAARAVGWEANGGFLTGTDIERDGRVLTALPTRDAALPLLAALCSATEQSLSVVDLFARLPRRFSKAGLIDNFPPASSRTLVRKFSPAESDIQEVEFADETVKLHRADRRVEPAAPPAAAEYEARRVELERFFGPKEGFGRIVRINTLDGVRVWFANGDIAHVRPSGNAPQLRIYAVADSPSRADEIVALGLREPDGILRRLEVAAAQGATGEIPEQGIRKNIALTEALFARGETPEVIGTVCGSPAARDFWQNRLDKTGPSFGAREAISFQEDLPTNQAFGLLLLWQRLKPHVRDERGSLVAFVFGDGTRSTPFTETDNAQKPAIATFVSVADGGRRRFLSMVELALKYFVPVQQYLRRSGFRGMIVKWGDEVQIPARDLSGADRLFEAADVVRFVSLREINADEARNKDWVGVDLAGRVTAFIPRRPLEQMDALADRGLVQRRDGKLFGGVNLGSIALSHAFLDCLLDEFKDEVNDATANRKDRPALDPEFFTALTVAAIDDPGAREQAWQRATHECAEVEALSRRFPDVLNRLQRAVRALEGRQGRKLRMVAMDFGDQYWGDIGQHAKIFDFYLALNSSGFQGEVARALAGLSGEPDGQGNRIIDSQVSPEIRVRNSVLINVTLSGRGCVEDSVLIGTRARDIQARHGFDVLSAVVDLRLEPRGGTYKVISTAPVSAGTGERLTTLFLPGRQAQIFGVTEETNLGDKAKTYAVPILGNPLSFQEAHRQMSAVAPDTLEKQRQAAEQAVMLAMSAIESFSRQP